MTLNPSWWKKGNPSQGGVRTYGRRQSKTCPKTCECGLQGRVTESVRYPEHVRRRYICQCGKRWSTYEVKLDGEE